MQKKKNQNNRQKIAHYPKHPLTTYLNIQPKKKEQNLMTNIQHYNPQLIQLQLQVNQKEAY